MAAPELKRRPDDRHLRKLLGTSAAGDQAAFALLYDAVAPVIFGLIRRVVRDYGMSEEVTQEVMLEIWTSAARFDPQHGSAMSWIVTIARRRAIDRVRSEQSSRDRIERIGPSAIERDHDPVEEQAIRADDIRIMGSALAELTNLQRQAIELAYFGGLTTSEIATRLELPVGTVKTRIRDGMLRLHESLRSSR